MDYRIEFDEKCGILLIAFHNDVTESSFLAAHSVVREFRKNKRILGRITDFSNARKVLLSGEFVRKLAISDLFAPSESDIVRIIVAPQPSVFGLARMFQTHREFSANAPTVVRHMDEALKLMNLTSLDLRPVE